MAGSVNKVILVGNVGADPEIRTMNSGDKLANLRIATSESWRDKSTGERKEKTEWHSIVIFNDGLVNVVEQYVKKGSKLYIEGQLQTRKWQDQNGNDRYTTEIVLQKYRGELKMLDSKGGNDENRGSYNNQSSQSKPANNQVSSQRYANQSNGGGYSPDLDSEVPF